MPACLDDRKSKAHMTRRTVDDSNINQEVRHESSVRLISQFTSTTESIGHLQHLTVHKADETFDLVSKD